MDCPPAYRPLDPVPWLGEVETDATESTEHGARPSDVRLGSDELDDAWFPLLALGIGGAVATSGRPYSPATRSAYPSIIRSTYFAITSTSRWTGSPTDFSERLVSS